MAFIKFLIIVFGIYYFMKLLIRAMFPFLVQKTYEGMQKQAHNRQQGHKSNAKPDGEVTIQDMGKQQGNPDKKSFGEYVDYEEVK